MSDPACRRFYVSGRVQGVGFRYATAEKARALGVAGYAKNLADGRVEVLACGPPTALEEFDRWLNEGPPGARVRGVSVETPSAGAVEAGFRIL